MRLLNEHSIYFPDKIDTVCAKDVEITIGVTFDEYKKFEDLRDISGLEQYSRLETRIDPLVTSMDDKYVCRTFWPLNKECVFEIKVRNIYINI